MGPSPESDGNTTPEAPPRRIAESFNGAVARERRNPKKRAVVAGVGIASMGPSPESDGNRFVGVAVSTVPRLQWGRRPRATEMWFPLATCPWHTELQWGRRPRATEMGLALPVRAMEMRRASMGPSPESDGNRERWQSSDHKPCGASMGPSPESDGNIRSIHGGRPLHDASMGPSPESDGNFLFRVRQVSGRIASMGPSPESDGNKVRKDRSACP